MKRLHLLVVGPAPVTFIRGLTMCGTDAALAVYCPLGGVTLTAPRVTGLNVLAGQMRKLRAEAGFEAQAA